MIPAWDYDVVHRQLAWAFKRRYGAGNSVRMVGVLFAPPQARLAREEIIPGLDYFHHRSGDSVDFFCAGYRRYGPSPDGDERPVSPDEPPWIFSAARYEAFRRDIERRSKWRYSGEVDLLIMNARYRKLTRKATLDFKSAIVCDLDRMIKDGAIGSTRRFFEQIFQFAEDSPGSDPAWGFSDKMGMSTAGSSLKRVVLSLLPKELGREYRKVEHFAVRDLTRAS